MSKVTSMDDAAHQERAAIWKRGYSNMVVPRDTTRCPKCGGELWRGAQGSIQCGACLWWGWLREERMNPMTPEVTKALREAVPPERMADWKRGYDAGYRAGQAELRGALREALGLDDRYERIPE